MSIKVKDQRAKAKAAVIKVKAQHDCNKVSRVDLKEVKDAVW